LLLSGAEARSWPLMSI